MFMKLTIQAGVKLIQDRGVHPMAKLTKLIVTNTQ